MKFKNMIAIATALASFASARPATAALKVVTTTEDLGSLAREVGGDKVQVDALAKGYQDPHFVDPKPSFILAGQPGRPADRRRPRAGNRLAAAAHHEQPQREDPGRRAGLSRCVAAT